MSVLGSNMAFLMKSIQQGKDTLTAPQQVRKVFTNFIH